MSSSMRNKKRQQTAVLAQVAANFPENIERRANERAEGLERERDDLHFTLERLRKQCTKDATLAAQRIDALRKLVRKQRNDILLLIGGYVVTVGAYALSLYLK